MVHRCVVNSVVMWLRVLVGPCWCVFVALFGIVYVALFGSRVYFRTVQHTQVDSTSEQCNIHK